MCKQILSLAYLHKHTISGMLSQENEKEERKTNTIEFFHIHIIPKLLCLSHEKHVQHFGVHHQRKGAWGANTPCKVQTHQAPRTMHLKQPNAPPPPHVVVLFLGP